MKNNTEGDQEKIHVKIDPRIIKLIPGFLENRRTDIVALRKAVEDSDFEKVRLLGHMMKGAGAGYGFPRITEIGRGLENSAASSQKDKISKLVDELEAFVGSVTYSVRD